MYDETDETIDYPNEYNPTRKPNGIDLLKLNFLIIIIMNCFKVDIKVTDLFSNFYQL